MKINLPKCTCGRPMKLRSTATIGDFTIRLRFCCTAPAGSKLPHIGYVANLLLVDDGSGTDLMPRKKVDEERRNG